MQALRAGDGSTARARFLEIVEAGKADADVWLAVALSEQQLGDHGAAHRAIDHALAMDSKNLRALLIKADCLQKEGQKRAASVYYRTVAGMVPDLNAAPPDVAQEVRRARKASEDHNAAFETFIRDQMAQHPESHRFDEALDLLTGKKQRFIQNPRAFFFPGLPNIQFYPREMFPWIEALEAATDDIQNELHGVMASPEAFAPYIHTHENQPVDESHSLLNDKNWSAHYLWRDGALQEQNAAKCPKTLDAVNAAPLEHIPGRAPMVLFSQLQAGAKIEPHTGFLNTRLICHLPLIAPKGCALRVGNEVREWRKGQAFVFDDSIEHEAWNRADTTRVVLIFAIWRPELSQEERALVSELMQAVDRFDDET